MDANGPLLLEKFSECRRVAFLWNVFVLQLCGSCFSSAAAAGAAAAGGVFVC